MKYLKTFESLQPIHDVTSDVNEFWEKFGEHIKKRDEKKEEKWKSEPNIRKRTDELLKKYGNMTDGYNYYDICNTDDYGRCTSTLTTVRAFDKDHAKLKCANKYESEGRGVARSLDIFESGYYEAKQVDIKKEISETETKISALQKKLEELKRIS